MNKINSSRIIPGTFLLLVFFFSCKSKVQQPLPIIRIAKTIPSVYTKATDNNLKYHNDTLYTGNSWYTGFLYSLDTHGDTIQLLGYYNGLREGMQRIWYDKNTLCEERFYINGKKEGTHKAWWPDGKPKFIFTASNDEYEGEFKEWYASGLLGKQFHYVNGQEEGSQRLWWDNGSVRANYVIREGRKYGLVGMKVCASPNEKATGDK